MPKFQCEKCSYEFDKDEAPSKCPYCDKEGSIKLYKTAQDWLNESLD